jgi:cation:H+ antiporter
VKSADWFTEAAVATARRLDVPEIIVGATIVSLATTLPEFAVSFLAALDGQTDITVGNAVGSTICNVGLILGLCAFLAPMAVAREGFFSSGLGLLVLASIFGVLGYWLPEGSRWVGAVMMACLLVYLVYAVRSSLAKRRRRPPEAEEVSGPRIALLFVVGAIGVVGGSRLMVVCGVHLARLMGVSELVIGLTFMAIGTSTPELVVAVTGILRKHRALSIGNIIGANILNLAWVIGACSLVVPLPVRRQTLVLDIPLMLLLSVLLLVFGLTGSKLSRWEGAVLFVLYASYVAVTFGVFGAAG